MSFDPTSFPYRTIVRITDTIGGQSWQGSGAFLSPDEILTASHVVYIAGEGTASNIVVAPAYSSGSTPFGTAPGSYIHYFQINNANDTISNSDSQYDYAIIHLSSRFSGLGHMGLLSNYTGGYVHVTGYPASANGLMIDSQQYVSRDPAYTLLDGQSIGQGSSGGPVWVSETSGDYIVGTVSSGNNGGTGYFTQISSSAFSQIQTWLTLDDHRGMNNFTGTATSDVLLQNGNGTVIDWIVGKGTFQGFNFVGEASGYNVALTGDFNGDGTADILFTSANGNGDVADWTMQNGVWQSSAHVGNVLSYGVVGAGDFNYDGTDDVLLENASGNVIDWMMQNGTYQGYHQVGNAAGWGVIGTGDFNGDIVKDVLLENGSGTVIDWIMQNGTFQNYNTIGNASGYGVVGKGDFNGDGTTDILLENGQGNVIDWMMQNGQYAGWHGVGNAAGYGIVATGDYNGDGTTDILLENNSHNVIDWSMQNGTYAGWSTIGNAGSYTVKGA